MQKSDKERVVAELTERLRRADTLIVSDYRGLTNAQLERLRDELIKHGARLSIVKNTLTRRAAEAAGTDALLALLEGPSAIAFIESDGDPVAVAKALSATARESRILAIRGGIMQGRSIDSDAVEELSKVPPLEVLRGQVIGAILGPLNGLLGLVNAPLRDFVGLIDARIEQLGGEGAAKPPVRDSGPGEGARGNRDVPPATEEAASDASGTEPQAPPADETASPAAETDPDAASGTEPQSPESPEENPEEE
jgi:large subunit ribosomal protein L10